MSATARKMDVPGAATEVYEVANIAYSACFVLNSGFTQRHDFKMTHLCCITVAWRHLTCVKQQLPSRKSLQALCGNHQGFRVCCDPLTEQRDLEDNMQHSVMYSMLLNAKSHLAEG